MAPINLKWVPLVSTALLAMACTEATPPPDAQYGGICVDEVTYQRIDDDRCGDYDSEGVGSNSGTFFMWINNTSTTYIPPSGGYVPRDLGVRKLPSNTPIKLGVPKTGATSMSTLTRGGFGVKAATVGGIGGKSSGGS